MGNEHFVEMMSKCREVEKDTRCRMVVLGTLMSGSANAESEGCSCMHPVP